MAGQVHWHEGLFLQPHHLQVFQRQLQEQFADERHMSWAYPYGVIESKLSGDALENMMVQFDRLRVVMPSGVYVKQGANMDLSALDIKRAFEAGSGLFTISLGVPLWYAGRANAVGDDQEDSRRVKRIFRVAEIECADENTGENPQPVMVRRINARLLLDDDDASDMEVLPLIRIAHATGDDVGLPRQDPGFVPACLVLGGSPVLRDLVRDLASQIEASRKELVLQMTRGGFRVENMRGIHFEQMLRLRTLNRFSARLTQMVLAPAVTPFLVYMELRGLLGELSALYPETDQFEVANYDHDNPAVAFNEISVKVRSMLRGTVKPSFIQVPFVPEGDILVAALTEEHVTAPNEYYLGVRTAEDPKALITLVEDQDQFKLMAQSMVTRAIWGVRLEAERVPPLELPSQTGLHYFRLNLTEGARMWERIVQEKSMAIRWPGMGASDFRAALYMTVPNAGDAP